MNRFRAPWTLSLVWWFGLGGLGFHLPYYALYLNENAGLSGAQAGLVLAVVPGLGALGHLVWGRIADRTGRRKLVLAAIACGSAVGFGAIGAQSSFVGFLLATALLALFVSSFAPITMSVCMAVLDEPGSHRLGRVRVWGTLGFAVAVLGMPWLLRALGGAAPAGVVSAPGLGVIFTGSALALSGATLAALAIPERVAPRDERSRRGEWRQLLAETSYLRALVFTFLMFLAIQGPMHLFPLLVRSHGGGVDAISRMWFWMLLLEIPLVLALGRTIGLAGPRAIVAIGSGAAALRWLVSGYTDDLTVLTVVQVLHGVTVWGVMIGVPVYVDSLVPGRLRSTAQGMIAFVGPALGGVVSNALAGELIDRFGGDVPARAGGWLALACVALVPILLPRPRSARLESDPRPPVEPV
jgi:PPP family 3-phenylpropionic acid transporter